MCFFLKKLNLSIYQNYFCTNNSLNPSLFVWCNFKPNILDCFHNMKTESWGDLYMVSGNFDFRLKLRHTLYTFLKDKEIIIVKVMGLTSWKVSPAYGEIPLSSKVKPSTTVRTKEKGKNRKVAERKIDKIQK